MTDPFIRKRKVMVGYQNRPAFIRRMKDRIQPYSFPMGSRHRRASLGDPNWPVGMGLIRRTSHSFFVSICLTDGIVFVVLPLRTSLCLSLISVTLSVGRTIQFLPGHNLDRPLRWEVET